MAPRRNYNKIPVIDKTRLRESFNRGEEFLQLEKILGINRTTAYSIVNRNQDKEIVPFRNGEEDHRRPGCRY